MLDRIVFYRIVSFHTHYIFCPQDPTTNNVHILRLSKTDVMDSNQQAVNTSEVTSFLQNFRTPADVPKPVASNLEALPTELKLKILRQLPDLATVSAIVHASPACHQLYRLARVEILTRFTIEHLLNVNEHALDRADFISIAFDGGEGARSRFEISCALSRLWTLVETGQTVELPIADCLALLRLRGIIYLNAQRYGY